MNKAAAGYAEEALDWIIRVQDPEFADWDALSAWLAANARQAELFQRLALWDDEIATDIADGFVEIGPPGQRFAG